jgi:hypothetical protein
MANIISQVSKLSTRKKNVSGNEERKKAGKMFH